MSRLYVNDDYDYRLEGLMQGWLRSAVRGKSGQRFLRGLVAALDALPTPELSSGALEDSATGCCCAFGAVRRFRGPENVTLHYHPEEDTSPDDLAKPFGVSQTLAWAVVQANDRKPLNNSEPDRRLRWQEVRAWAVCRLLSGGEEAAND